MQSIVFVAQEDETLAPFLAFLKGRGFHAAMNTLESVTGERSPEDIEPAAVILDLATLGDRIDLQEIASGFKADPQPALLALVTAQQLAEFNPVPGLADFLLRTATAEELLARIRHALWRKSRLDSEDTLHFGDLVMDIANYKVYVEGRHVELTYKEYELLRFLASNSDRVFSRDALLNQVWGYDYYGGARTVDVHIRRLRSKIEDVQHTFIETVRNVGYRFRS